MKKDKKNWYVKFSFKAYESDLKLRLCSFAAQGLWMRMLCIMDEGEPYGHLSLFGKTLSVEELSSATGKPEIEVRELLEELENKGIFSRTKVGCIYNRRMVRDQEISEIRTAAGRKGGNPKYIKRTTQSDLHNQNSNQNSEQTDNQTDNPNSNSKSNSKKEEPKTSSLEDSPQKSPQRRASRIPGDWQPTLDEIAYAETRGLDAGLVAERFLNYWLGAKDGAKVDWSATWKTWCLKAAERGECLRAGVVGPTRASGPSAKEIAMQRVLGGLDAASKTHNDVSKVLEGTAEEIV